MTKDDLHRLAAEIETDQIVGRAGAGRLADAISAAFPDRPLWQAARTEVFGSTDALLAVVAEALPSWSVHLSGASATVRGRWTCTIRETGVRDDDELIGVGKAGSPAQAITAALLNVIALRRGQG
jgi:hypothetical protein